MRTPCWSLQKLGTPAGAASSPSIACAAPAPCRRAASQCSVRTWAPQPWVVRPAGVAGGEHAGDGGAAAASVRTPRSSRPLLRSHAVAGSVPIPTTSASQAMRRPSSSSTCVEGAGAVEAGDAGRQQDLDALLPVQPREPSAELLSEHDGQRRRGGLDDRDLGAQATCGRCDLLADEPGADDDHAGSGAQRVAQPAGVGERAQLVDVGVALGAGQPRGARCRWRSSSCPYRRREPSPRTTSCAPGVELHCGGSEHELDVVLVVPPVGAEAQRGLVALAGEELLRQAAGGRRARRAPRTPSAVVRHSRCDAASRRPVALRARRRRSRRRRTGGAGARLWLMAADDGAGR